MAIHLYPRSVCNTLSHYIRFVTTLVPDVVSSSTFPTLLAPVMIDVLPLVSYLYLSLENILSPISIETLLLMSKFKIAILDISGIVCKPCGSFALPRDLESDCSEADYIYLYLI
jgi:hypothetical protein